MMAHSPLRASLLAPVPGAALVPLPPSRGWMAFFSRFAAAIFPEIPKNYIFLNPWT